MAEVTEKTTSEVVKTDDVKVDPSTTTDVNAKSSDAEVPWHKDSRFKDDLEALKIGKSIKSVLDANDLTDIEDLKDLVESGKKVHGKKLDLENLDEIMEDSKTLKKYQKFWAQQEELNKQNMEAPEETIARLKKERDEVVNKVTARELSEKEQKEAKQSVAFYEREVNTLLESAEFSKSEKEFLAWSLGVGNECNEIQITDKKAIRKVLNDGVKKYNTLVEDIKNQAVKDYLAGKKGIPNVASTDGTVATTNIEPPKGLKNLRRAFQDSMKGGSQ
jgi:hypothetical protein